MGNGKKVVWKWALTWSNMRYDVVRERENVVHEVMRDRRDGVAASFLAS